MVRNSCLWQQHLPVQIRALLALPSDYRMRFIGAAIHRQSMEVRLCA